jgi:hypothetical protein
MADKLHVSFAAITSVGSRERADAPVGGPSWPPAASSAHDVALLHDQELDAVDLDLGARPFAKRHVVGDRDVDGNEFPSLVAGPGPAMTSPCDGFSWAVSGMTMPPADFSSASCA